MIDVMALLATVNLRSLIEQDGGPTKNKRIFCPFCQSAGKKTSPALQIYGDKNYHCFGCGANGNAINYIMQRQNVKFLEACQILGWNGGQISNEELKASVAEFHMKQEQETQRRALELAEILADYTAEERWLAYEHAMTEENKAWWRSQGIPDDWQEYLRLGFNSDKAYYDKDKVLRHSPAYTIPYFHQGFTFQNMQYRLTDPTNPKDRYRFEAHLKTVYYMTSPSEPMFDQAMICEGAKKAIVTKVFEGEGTTVLATPSKVDTGGVADVVKDCGRVWIIPDPDAYTKPINASDEWKPWPLVLATRIGKAARIVRLPVKVDDGILTMGLNLKKYMRMATKL
jgi:hypothetical protein